MIGLQALFENFIETGTQTQPSKFDIGPISSLISYNFYDGLRLRIGGQTTANLNTHLFIKGYYGHALKSHQNYYDTQLTYAFNSPSYLSQEFPKRSVTFESRRDVALPSDKFMEFDKDNVFASLKLNDMDKMFLYNSQSIRIEYETFSKFKCYGEVKTEKVNPIGNIAFERLLQNSSLKDYLRYTEGTIGFRYAPGETYINTKQQRWALNYNRPIVRIQHTLGMKGFLGGQYNYNYTELKVSKPFWLPLNFGCLEARMMLGAQWNQVPFPLLIMPASNMSIFLDKHAFNLINNMEFLNDRFISFEINWDLNGKILNLIPLLKKLKCREFIGFKGLLGKLTDKNNPYLHENQDSEILIKFPEGCNIMNPHKPYLEYSVGLHNIFNLLHIEYIRRLTYLDLPTSHKSAIKFALEFKF